MVAVGENVGVARGEQIDLLEWPVSHLMDFIFFSAYLIIISGYSHSLCDRQVRVRKVPSSRNSLDDRTQSRRPLGFLLGDSWDDKRW